MARGRKKKQAAGLQVLRTGSARGFAPRKRPRVSGRDSAFRVRAKLEGLRSHTVFPYTERIL